MTKKTGDLGDSIRRQIENQNIAVEKYNLCIAETFSDYAKSAFRGKNRLSGALATFLERLEKGEIQEHSYLLIESFDRLSRERMTNGLQTVLRILQKKVKIVTTDDLKLYDLSIPGRDLEQTIMITVLLERANNESVVKSQRQRAKWESRRELIMSGQKKFLNKNVPWWLSLSEKGEYSLIAERVTEIKKIISYIVDDNLGLRAAASRINEQNPLKTSFRSSKEIGDVERGWTARGIKRLIESPSLYGCLELCENIYDADKPTFKRKSIHRQEGFYPAVYSRAEVDVIRARIESRMTNKEKPTKRDKHYYNVFHGLIKCSLCGGNVRYSQKRTAACPSKYNYLVCRNSEIKLCKHQKALTVHYSVFSDVFFRFAKHYNIEALMSKRRSNASEDLEKIKELENRVESEKHKAHKFSAQLFELFGEIPDEHKATLLASNKLIKTLEKQIKELRISAEDVNPSSESTADAIADAAKLLETKEGRLKLNNHLRDITDYIELYNAKAYGSKFSGYQIRFKSGRVHNVVFNQEQSFSLHDEYDVFLSSVYELPDGFFNSPVLTSRNGETLKITDDMINPSGSISISSDVDVSSFMVQVSDEDYVEIQDFTDEQLKEANKFEKEDELLRALELLR